MSSNNVPNRRVEVMAGLTSFFAISYIVIVNPLILADGGIPAELSVFATIFASAIGCLLMAFWADAPIILTPGMGINAFFTYTVVVNMGFRWQEALAISLVSALIFFALAVTRAGRVLADAVPKSLKYAVTAGIGLFLVEIGLEKAGAPGTTAALALLNDQVKKGGIMASSYVGGLSGAFIPVSEDRGMIEAVGAGALTLEKLEAMTCVCSVGLDMIAIPGDTSEETISGIIADEMAIGMVNQKTSAVRLIPVIGKGVGDRAEFGGLLGYAPIMPVNSFSCNAFVNRGGRIPAPVHSFKN